MQFEQIGAALKVLVGADKVLLDAGSRAERAHDFWLLDFQRRLHGAAEPLPLCVVMASSSADVSAVLAFAHRNGIPVVPYGAGSGVCGGSRPGEGAIVLDLRNMNNLLELNETSLTVRVQPGMMGSDLEAALNKAGYSMGHFPQSIKLSSVGGWVATRASGQYSTKYGGIEDMLVCFKGILADGTPVATRDVPRSSAGPSVNQLILGSEGTLAVLTELTFKIHPLPEKQVMRAFQFARFSQGLEAIRKMLRVGWKPPLARLYDSSETQRHFAKEAKPGSCMLLLLSEGPAGLAEAELAGCSAIALAEGGTDAGTAPVEHWLEKRFNVPDLRSLALEKGVVFDTIEVAGNWDCIQKLYEDVIEGLLNVPGIVAASAHSSHSYQQGTCLYFTFAVKKPHWLMRQVLQRVGSRNGFASPADLEAIERAYNSAWTAVMEATLANNGTISHHHGVGKVRLPWIEQELGLSYPVLVALKRALDPAGILNPGTLLKS